MLRRRIVVWIRHQADDLFGCIPPKFPSGQSENYRQIPLNWFIRGHLQGGSGDRFLHPLRAGNPYIACVLM